MRVAEAEKIKKRYQDKLKSKDAIAAGYVLGEIIQGDGGGAVRGMAEAKRLTEKERYELERAEAIIKSKVIDDLECFRAPEKNQ